MPPIKTLLYKTMYDAVNSFQYFLNINILVHFGVILKRKLAFVIPTRFIARYKNDLLGSPLIEARAFNNIK